MPENIIIKKIKKQIKRLDTLRRRKLSDHEDELEMGDAVRDGKRTCFINAAYEDLQ